MNRSVTALSAGLLFALASTSAAAADATGGNAEETATITVSGMYFVPDGVEVTTAPKVRSQTFTVVAPEGEIDARIAQRIEEASAQVSTLTRVSAGGGANPSLSNTVFGGCGSSYVIFNSTSSQTQGQGYVEAGFDLTGVSTTGAFATDTLVFSEAALDLWTYHLKDSGNLANGRSWSKGTRVDIPKTQTYGAHFYVGTVKVTVGNQSGTCSTIGPRVDDLMLYKS